MAQAASIAAQAVLGFLTATETGLAAAIQEIATNTGISLAPVLLENIVYQNTPAGLAEKHLQAKYPAVLVYVDRVQNLLVEKFRTFSGKVRTVTEIRASQDRLEGLEEQLRLYVDAVTQILDANRGSWGTRIVLYGSL